MAQIKKIVEQIQNKSLQLSKNTSEICLIKKDGYSELSVYDGELTKPVIANSILKLQMSFPTLPNEFYEILSDRIKANGFSDKRLQDSIDYVIDNCVYPTPTIAQFISFDKHIKLYTYDQIMSMLNENPGVFKSHKSVKIKGISKPMYAHVTDIEHYNLELFNRS